MLRHTLCQKPPVGSPLFFLQVLLHPLQDLAESADAVGGLSLSAQAVVLTVEHAQLALHTMELERCEHFQTVGQRAAVILICVNKECGRLNTVGIGEGRRLPQTLRMLPNGATCPFYLMVHTWSNL